MISRGVEISIARCVGEMVRVFLSGLFFFSFFFFFLSIHCYGTRIRMQPKLWRKQNPNHAHHLIIGKTPRPPPRVLLRYRNNRSEDKNHEENPSKAPLNKRKPVGTKEQRVKTTIPPVRPKRMTHPNHSVDVPRKRGGCAIGRQAPKEAVQYQENPSLSEVQP